MSLFYKLLRLTCGGKTQEENFHTELVAQVLRDSPQLTLRWLARFGLPGCANGNNAKVLVNTQENFHALMAHNGLDSRPDISIRIPRGEQTQFVFVESKIGSKEGHIKGFRSQLERYADHLDYQSKKENP